MLDRDSIRAHVTLFRDDWEKLSVLAKRANTTKSNLVREIVRVHLKESNDRCHAILDDMDHDVQDYRPGQAKKAASIHLLRDSEP